MMSIIIPVYNALDYAALCVESVLENTSDFEIIIVDNGSNPPVPAGFPFSECRVLRNEENLGFPVGANQGVSVSSGKYLCILNSDTIVMPNWADNLIASLQVADIVSPCCNTRGYGPQQISLTYYDKETLDAAVVEYTLQATPEVEYLNWLVGFCMVLPRTVWDALGGFDEDFGLGNGEDQDFCIKAVTAGYMVGVTRNVFIHHFGEATKNTFSFSQVMQTLRANYKLAAKWGNLFYILRRQEII